MQVMGNSRKSNKANNSLSKGGKGARRKQQQTAGLVSALARATERVERLEGEKAALEDQIRLLATPTPVVFPPQHVLDLATAIRDSTARHKGSLVTFDDTFIVLKVYANCILSSECKSHTEAVWRTATDLQMSPKTVFFIVNECKDKGGNLYQMGVGGTASARGCGSSRYSSDHSIFKKEMLIWAHQQVMRLLKEDKTLTSYAELHRRFEERYDLGSSCSGLRSAMIRTLDYEWQKFSRERSSKKLIIQMRQFMIRYAGVLFSACIFLCPNHTYIL